MSAEGHGGSIGSASKAEIEQELIEAQTENNTVQALARARLHQLIYDDVDELYLMAKALAVFGDSRTDQVKAQVLKMLFDKIAPDLKSIGRGGGGARASALVNFNLGGERAAVDVTPKKGPGRGG